MQRCLARNNHKQSFCDEAVKGAFLQVDMSEMRLRRLSRAMPPLGLIEATPAED